MHIIIIYNKEMIAVNNMLNPKLLELLSTVDKQKLEQVSNMVKNMSKDDINNLLNLLGMNNSGNTTNTNG